MGRKSIFLYPSHCLGQISSTNILELWNNEDAWVLMQSPFQNSRPLTMSQVYGVHVKQVSNYKFVETNYILY